MSGDGIEDRRMLRERELQIEYGLSIRESEVVAAREDGLTNVEIARLMGITRQSVSNLLSKARAKGVRLDEGRALPRRAPSGRSAAFKDETETGDRITHPRARARVISSKNSTYSDFTGRLAWKRERSFSINERAPPARYVVIGSPQNTTCTERGENSRSRPGEGGKIQQARSREQHSTRTTSIHRTRSKKPHSGGLHPPRSTRPE